MKRLAIMYLMLFSSVFILSGCLARTYTWTRDRIDQDLSAGNRGYLTGQRPAGDERERSLTRTTRVLEIELGPSARQRKASKIKAQEIAPAADISNYSEEIKTELPEADAVSLKAASALLSTKYTVAKGETLQKISQKFYGTTKRWKKIYEANMDTMKGPDKVYAGQVINIPAEGLKETKENLK